MLRLISKLITSQTGKQIIIIQVLPNISRKKAARQQNSVSCFYSMRNIFLEKSYTICGGEASLRPFYKK